MLLLKNYNAFFIVFCFTSSNATRKRKKDSQTDSDVKIIYQTNVFSNANPLILESRAIDRKLVSSLQETPKDLKILSTNLSESGKREEKKIRKDKKTEEIKILGALDNKSSTSEKIMEDLTVFCLQEQIKKQGHTVYKSTSSTINFFNNEKAMFYTLNLEYLRSFSESFEVLFLSGKFPKPDFKTVDKRLIVSMKKLMGEMRKHVVQIEGSEVMRLNNSSEMHRLLSLFVFEIKSITEYNEATIKGFGSCIGLLSIELINLQKWHSKIPELIILNSRISSTAEHPMLLMFLRSLNVYLNDKKEVNMIDREIIFSLILKFSFHSTKQKYFDFLKQQKFILYNINCDENVICRMPHQPIVYIFIWNLFRDVKSNLRKRLSENEESIHLSYEQLNHIKVLLNIHLYGHLRIIELFNYESYNSEEYTLLLNELKKEIGCYGCLFSKY